MKRFIIFCFSIQIFLHIPYAQACKKSRIKINNVTFPWTQSDQQIPISIKITRKKSNNTLCNYISMGFSLGNSNNYNRYMLSGQKNIPYNIYKDQTTNQSLRTINDFNTSNNPLIYIPSNQKSVTFDIYARLPINDTNYSSFRKGNYKDVITATTKYFYLPTDPTTNKNFRIRTQIPAIVDISLVDSGDNFNINDTDQTLNFGTLEENEILSFDLKVKSNVNYSVYFESLNNNSLKHISDNFNIPYSIKINGTTKPLSNNTLIASKNYTNSNQGDLFQIDVQIGNISNKLEGQYSDIIYITTVSNN